MGCHWNTDYVLPLNFLAPGSRDMFDANNKAIDYLYRSLCESEFKCVRTEDLACRIWEQLKNANVGNAQVHARLFVTYRRENENFTHLPGEYIDAMFLRFMVIVSNMRANVALARMMTMTGLSSSCVLWIVQCGVGKSRPS
jgi:hypothetical protein